MSEVLSQPEDYGQLLAFDGINGVGKSTQINHVAKRLTAAGLDVFATTIHGGTPIGNELRKVSRGKTPRLPKVDLLISLAMHAQLFPELEERRSHGQTILLDRSPLSITAFQSYGDRLPLEVTRPHVDEEMAIIRPDLLIIYDATVKIARLRARAAAQNKEDYFEKKGADYHERVRRGYLDEAARFAPQYDIAVINTEQSQIEVSKRTMHYVLSSLLQASES